MTGEAVQQAVRDLEARGQLASLHNVNRHLRSVPPYRGMSYRDLIPLLRNQQVTPTDPAYASVVNMAHELEEALARRRNRDLPALIERGEQTWSKHVRAMYEASRRGDPAGQLEAWASAFEQLRCALSAAIVQVHGGRRG